MLYSGPIGLGIYYYAGRKQIDHDSFWRKGFRSVAHCYSGCGAGEVTGVVVAVGIGIWLAGETRVSEVLFWSSFVLSLTIGLIAAYPANLVVVYLDVMEGVMNPRKMGSEMDV